MAARKPTDYIDCIVDSTPPTEQDFQIIREAIRQHQQKTRFVIPKAPFSLPKKHKK